MPFSARNIFIGTVASVNKGAVNAEVILNLKGGPPLTVVITNTSVDDLVLKEGKEVFAIIKSSSIEIGTNLRDAKFSASNVLCGSVVNVTKGPISTEIDLDIGYGNTMNAVITTESAKRLELETGSQACAMINASSIILGIKEKNWGIRQEASLDD